MAAENIAQINNGDVIITFDKSKTINNCIIQEIGGKVALSVNTEALISLVRYMDKLRSE